MSDYSTNAQATADAVRREIRDGFQVQHPHYTPPPGASEATWTAWFEANIAMHGVDGFMSRGLHQVPQIDSMNEMIASYLRARR